MSQRPSNNTATKTKKLTVIFQLDKAPRDKGKEHSKNNTIQSIFCRIMPKEKNEMKIL